MGFCSVWNYLNINLTHYDVCDICCFVVLSKIEGSHATARHTAELLRSVISQQRIPYTNQTGALIDAVKAVGEQLIAANPVGMTSSLCNIF